MRTRSGCGRAILVSPIYWNLELGGHSEVGCIHNCKGGLACYLVMHTLTFNG